MRSTWIVSILAGAIVAGTEMGSASAAEPLRLAAAGSLRSPMQEIAAAFTQATDLPVNLEFGASGMLRDKIAASASADVFASANLEHPAALAKAGKALPEIVFARNRLCALARPEVAVTPATLLATLLDPAIRLGTSTPKSDPSGDYAWQVFTKAETLKPGARATLEAKALQLTGGPTSPQPPTDRSIYGLLLETHKADVMLIYCTAARQAAREVTGLHIVELPEPLAVGADYGLTVLKGSRPGAERLALFILSGTGQTILARYGFAAPALPAAP